MMKVAVIEDERAFLQELVFTVDWEAWDCLVVGSAQDGASGLALIAEKKPDIVVTDIRMPGMDGLRLVEAAREALGGEGPEFIIISGYDDFEYARTALRLGVRNYLLKPLDDEELEASIRRLKAEIEDRRSRTRLERTMDEGQAGTLMLFREYELGRRQDPQSKYVAAAISHIQESYQRDLSVDAAAERLGISSGYLSRIFKKETGYTFGDYLMYYRVKRAVELLTAGEHRIYEVADLVGYSDQRYFSQVFKRIVGLTPSQFKDGL